MVSLTGIHENVMLSNLFTISTKGAIESVHIFTGCLLSEEVEFRESLKVFFFQDKANCL